MLVRRLVLVGLAVVALTLLLLGRRERSTPPEALPRDVAAEGLELAIFAGGCFWCMEPPFDAVPGVRSTTSGYTGGQTVNPSYEDVSSGGTGHAEALRVEFDPRQVSYGELLEVFWHNIDPLTANAQFCDHGTQYRTAIFYRGEEQQRLAQASLQALGASGRFSEPIVTELTAASAFYPAEDYHQDYYKKNPVRYKYYRFACGRDQRLAELWGSAPESDAGPAHDVPTAAPAPAGEPAQPRAEAALELEDLADDAQNADDPALLRELLEQALSEEGLSAEERELLQTLIEHDSGTEDDEPAEPAPAPTPQP